MNKVPNFEKNKDGLLPVIIQDIDSHVVLMLGYMNKEAFEKTKESKLVTFFSRSKQRLWTKGETSSNFLHLKEILVDCDQDAILIKAKPAGVVCHTGADTCFFEENKSSSHFLYELERIIVDRLENPIEGSYTNKIAQKGIAKVAQKVGEEAVESLIEAVKQDKEKLLEEGADLMYHFILMLQVSGLNISAIENVLRERHQKK